MDVTKMRMFKQMQALQGRTDEMNLLKINWE